jgi:hypothetical protein
MADAQLTRAASLRGAILPAGTVREWRDVNLRREGQSGVPVTGAEEVTHPLVMADPNSPCIYEATTCSSGSMSNCGPTAT